MRKYYIRVMILLSLGPVQCQTVCCQRCEFNFSFRLLNINNSLQTTKKGLDWQCPATSEMQTQMQKRYLISLFGYLEIIPNRKSRSGLYIRKWLSFDFVCHFLLSMNKIIINLSSLQASDRDWLQSVRPDLVPSPGVTDDGSKSKDGPILPSIPVSTLASTDSTNANSSPINNQSYQRSIGLHQLLCQLHSHLLVQ
jgi:hypothetical protein